MLLTLSELQEITELSPTTISNILAEKGLKMTCGIPADRLEKDKDLVSQLGTMSDDKFSRISGYSRGTIRTVRKRLNIASYRSGLSKDRANE